MGPAPLRVSDALEQPRPRRDTTPRLTELTKSAAVYLWTRSNVDHHPTAGSPLCLRSEGWNATRSKARGSRTHLRDPLSKTRRLRSQTSRAYPRGGCGKSKRRIASRRDGRRRRSRRTRATLKVKYSLQAWWERTDSDTRNHTIVRGTRGSTPAPHCCAPSSGETRRIANRLRGMS